MCLRNYEEMELLYLVKKRNANDCIYALDCKRVKYAVSTIHSTDGYAEKKLCKCSTNLVNFDKSSKSVLHTFTNIFLNGIYDGSNWNCS